MRTIFLIMLMALSFQVSACMFPAPQGQRHERSDGGNDRREDHGREQGQRGGDNDRDHEQRHDGRN